MIRLFSVFVRAVADILRHPVANLMTLFTITLVVALAGVFLMLLHNVNTELLKSRGQVEFQVYWQPGADPVVIRAQQQELSRMKGLAALKAYSPEQALKELSEALAPEEAAGSETFSWLQGENPLPASLWLSFRALPGPEGQAWAERMLQTLRALPGVSSVHYNPMQMELAHGWTGLANRLLWPVIGLLALVVALVVGNTMRLSLLTRRDEIEILSLVGAKPWYIRGPLMAAGMLLGLLGSGLGLGGLALAQRELENVLNFPPLFLKIQFLPVEQWAALAGVCTLVCMLGSFVAVRK